MGREISGVICSRCQIVNKVRIEQQDELSLEELKNLIYEGFISKFLKVFLTNKTRNTNGKTCGFDNIRKYFDAVQFGAKKVNTALPIFFRQGLFFGSIQETGS